MPCVLGAGAKGTGMAPGWGDGGPSSAEAVVCVVLGTAAPGLVGE